MMSGLAVDVGVAAGDEPQPTNESPAPDVAAPPWPGTVVAVAVAVAPAA
jgi:hypothetical protein